MRCFFRVLFAVMILPLALVSTIFAAEQDKRPNIIIMMADDMGFSDIGCYGGEIQTPTLDGLAADGIRFTQFYNTSRCCPTRACLMTGLYPHQAGVGHMMDDRGLDGYRGNLNRHCRTIPEVLGPAGYRCYMSGKWHVTRHVAPDGPKFNWPLQRGFDRFFGTIHGAGSFYDPNSLTRDNTQIPPGSDDFYYTDAISDNAVEFVTDHKQQHADQPFFMYVAFTSPHWPMHARERDVAKYKGLYDKGWDAVRAERHKRMIEMGIVKSEWPITPRDPAAPAWEDAELKEWNARCMEVYAAMIDCMDQGVERIVAALKENGQLDNTLILFLADNGGCAEGMGRGRNVTYRDKNPDEIIPMKPRELQRDMIPKRTRDGRVMRQGQGVMPGPADTYIGYGLPWANVSNTPFRRYKHWVHEGGISSSLIAHWPVGIDEKLHSKLYHDPAHLIDLAATSADLSRAEYPDEVDGQTITPLQGVSLKPSFTNQPLGREKPIFWEHEGNRAIRDGKWKLVALGATGPWELYDLEADRTELNNLADKHPDHVQAMVDAWEKWAVDANVKPWIWGPKKKKR